MNLSRKIYWGVFLVVFFGSIFLRLSWWQIILFHSTLFFFYWFLPKYLNNIQEIIANLDENYVTIDTTEIHDAFPTIVQTLVQRGLTPIYEKKDYIVLETQMNMFSFGEYLILKKDRQTIKMWIEDKVFKRFDVLRKRALMKYEKMVGEVVVAGKDSLPPPNR